MAAPLLAWVSHNPSAELAAALDAAIEAPDPGPAHYAARASLPGGLPEAVWRELGASPSPAMRAVVARHSPRAQASELASLTRATEPSHQVRAAAVERLAAVAFDRATVVAALGDGHPIVRMAAARALARRGDDEVPTFRGVAFDGTPLAQQAAVTGLRIRGSRAAADVLHEIVADHPSESLQRIAAIALGEPLGEVHPPQP